MTVSRLSTLKEFGIFRDFTWPNDLSEFGKYNLIYGWNGSGKTTLSRLFRAMELSQTPGMGTVTVKVDDSSVAGSDFPNSTFPIRVFNTDFVRASVFPTGGELAPIFVIGESSVEKQKEVERLRAELGAARSEQSEVNQKQNRAAEALDKFCVDRAKAIKEQLRSSGQNKYNNYDKGQFSADVQNVIQNNSATSSILSDIELTSQLSQSRASSKYPISTVSYTEPNFPVLEQAVAELLSTTVVSTVIEALKDDSDLSSWTRTGLSLHVDRRSGDCLFCGQVLPEDAIARLEAHFSTEFEEFQDAIDRQESALNELITAIDSVGLPKRAEIYDDLGDDLDSAISKLRSHLSENRDRLRSLSEQLANKKGKPFTSLTLNGASPSAPDDSFQKVNDLIERHNGITNDFQNKVRQARENVANHYIAESVAEYSRLRDEHESAMSALAPISSRIQLAEQRIRDLEREIVEHREPAEELNEDLKKYLGHSELELTVSDTGYTVTRNGQKASYLSEGEMTAIALLYFLKSIGDRSFDKSKGLVVLDDPVSSLDSSAMYLALSLIRERTSAVGQILILTHNFPFFRQARNWLTFTKEHQFYMLQCTSLNGRRTSQIRRLDPLLAKYESEYHYLFSCLYKAAKTTESDRFDEYYHFPNIARRTLENFLAFRHPGTYDNMWAALKEVKTSDEARKARILNFVQTHSHGPSVGQPGHDPFILGECQAIIRDLLDLIKDEDRQHFEAMEKLAEGA